MNARTKLVSSLIVGLAFSGMAAPAPGFARIASELDLDGEYLEVVDAATFESDIEGFLDVLLQAAVQTAAVKRKDLDEIAQVRQLVKSAGLLSLRGRGYSVRPEGNGTYVHKSFLLAEKGKTPLLDVVACKARPSVVESYLPRATALAVSFSADVRGTALFAADAMDALDAEDSAVVRAFCQPAGGKPSLAEGILPGTLLAVTLGSEETFLIPETKSRIPAPGVLLVQALADARPWLMLRSSLKAGAKKDAKLCRAVRNPKFPEVDQLVFQIPELKALGFAPTLAYDQKGGVLILASSAEILDTALAAGRNRIGRLLDEPVFQSVRAASGDLSGISYLSPRFVKVLARFLRRELPGKGVKVPPALDKTLAEPPQVWCAGAHVRLADGVKYEGRAGFGAGNTLRMLGLGGGESALGLAGVLGGALFPAISQARLSAQTSAFAMRGRNLFVAIVQANTEREAAGLPAVWPRTRVAADADKDDIAGRAFGSACDYFNVLFDTGVSATKREPYVCADPGVLGAQPKGNGRFRVSDIDWCVAADLSDDLDDCVPVLVSANFNPKYLLAQWDGVTDAKKPLPIGPASGASKSLFGNKAIVVVRKGGASQVIKARYLTYETLYNRRAFGSSKGTLTYLTPTGMAVPASKSRSGK